MLESVNFVVVGKQIFLLDVVRLNLVLSPVEKLVIVSLYVKIIPANRNAIPDHVLPVKRRRPPIAIVERLARHINVVRDYLLQSRMIVVVFPAKKSVAGSWIVNSTHVRKFAILETVVPALSSPQLPKPVHVEKSYSPLSRRECPSAPRVPIPFPLVLPYVEKSFPVVQSILLTPVTRNVTLIHVVLAS